MAIENGKWIMRGMDWNDPYRIRSWQELIHWIDKIGFLPLFKNEIEGFSAEELVYEQVLKHFPAATQAALQAVLGWDRSYSIS